LNKFLTQLTLTLLIFFSVWFLLSRIDFTGNINFKKIGKSTEKKLGDLTLRAIQREDKELENDSVLLLVNSIKQRICSSNNFNADEIKVHVFCSKTINAYSLPDNHLVVYTGLINYCHNPEELSAVMAHEIAHIENKHVMKKLSEEVGLAVLVTISGAGSSPGVIQRIVKLLTSTAFDRSKESEADAKAVQYLAKANIDPEHFADFLLRLSQDKENISFKFDWVSTHPNSKDRAGEILKLSKKETYKSIPIFSTEEWERLKIESKTEDCRR
jgi:predicted Zn-dependent protease